MSHGSISMTSLNDCSSENETQGVMTGKAGNLSLGLCTLSVSIDPTALVRLPAATARVKTEATMLDLPLALGLVARCATSGCPPATGPSPYALAPALGVLSTLVLSTVPPLALAASSLFFLFASSLTRLFFMASVSLQCESGHASPRVHLPCLKG